MKNVDLIFEDLYKKSSNIFNLNNENKVSSILLFKDYISHLKEWKELLGTDYRPFGTSLNLQENNLIKDVNEDFLKELTSFEVFFNNFKDKFKIDENLIGGRVINYWFIYIYTGNFSNKKKSLKKLKIILIHIIVLLSFLKMIIFILEKE